VERGENEFTIGCLFCWAGGMGGSGVRKRKGSERFLKERSKPVLLTLSGRGLK